MSQPPDKLALGDLYVCYTRSDAIATPAQVERCQAMLSEDERARHRRFRFEADQQSYLAAHALTRGVLGRLLSVEPSRLRFVAGERGRPELVWPEGEPRVRFNLSHTRGLVACAVALQADVGVDVENVDRRVDIDHLAPSVFSEFEREALRGLAADPRRTRFFELWTLKEAYIKAVGIGLGLPLGAITLHLDAEPRPRIAFDGRVTDDPARWFFALQPVASEHMLAVAVACAKPTSCVVHELFPYDL